MTSSTPERKVYNINIKSWQQKLGSEMLVNIIRLLVGVNRIYSLWHLMTQTAKPSEEINKAKSARDRFTSFVLSNGILQELYQTLGPLAGIVKEKNSSIYRQITNIINDFDKNPLRRFLTEFRDKIAFHVDEDIVATGIDAVGDKEVSFIEFESTTYGDAYYSFADDISIQGFFGFFKDKLQKSKDTNFEEFYERKLEEFMLYSYEIQKSLIMKVDALISTIVSEFQLETTRADSS